MDLIESQYPIRVRVPEQKIEFEPNELVRGWVLKITYQVHINTWRLHSSSHSQRQGFAILNVYINGRVKLVNTVWHVLHLEENGMRNKTLVKYICSKHACNKHKI